MVCPNCKNDTIPFSILWLKGGLGTYRCSSCNAVCRIKESTPLTIISSCIGAFATVLGYYFRSWLVFGAALAIGLLLDAVLDSSLRRLELVEEDERQKSMTIIAKLQNTIIKNAKRYQIFFVFYGVLSLFNFFFGIYALYEKGYPAIVWFYRAMIGFFFVQAIICFFVILALSIIRKMKIAIT